jgi:hypothetical protein
MALLNDAPVPRWRRIVFGTMVVTTVVYAGLSALMGDVAPWHASERQITAALAAWWTLTALILARRVRRRMMIRRLTRRIGR